MEKPATASRGGDLGAPRDAVRGAAEMTLERLVVRAEGVVARVCAAQVAEVRMLADAGRLAESRAAAASARVRAHDMELRSIAAELGGVLRLSDRMVQARIGDAVEMVERYPRAVEAWEAGLIGRGHMTVIVAAGRAVPEGRRAEFEEEALDRCLRDTPNRVRAGLEIYAERLAERDLTERHAEAVRERAVRVFPGRDGMCDVVATVPMVIRDAILDRLTRMGQSIQDSARNDSDAAATASACAGASRDQRGIDQIRADVFADLLLAGTPALDPTRHGDRDGDLGAIRAQVQVVVPALALIGHDESPADLIGRAPIDADTARRLARNTPSLTRVLTDPASGTVIAVDSYRPGWAQRRHLRARDQHCRFPGCRTAAIRCELDHTHDHARGGPTALTNLAHLCQRHHSMKQFTRWTVRQVGGGTLEWTSETGRVYREDAPAPPVAFMPSTAPPDPPPHRTVSPKIRDGDHADLRLPLDPDPEAIDRFFERLEYELGVGLARERERDPAPF